MQRLPLLIATHALVLGVGYGWHRTTAVPEQPPTATPTSPARPAAKPTVREAGSVSEQPGESPRSASECRKAWLALNHAGLSPTELAILRSKILAEWAAKDLRSALIAWSDLGRPKPAGLWVAGGMMAPGPLIDRGFSFHGREEELLNWIYAGDFGLDSGQLLGILNPSVLSRWALQLPAREETTETFRHAVDAKFRKDLAGSVTWAKSLPVGWHREQALAQLAITADTFHHDPATRNAVLAELTDPAILAEVGKRLRAQKPKK